MEAGLASAAVRHVGKLRDELSDVDRRRLERAAKVVAAPKLRVVLEEAPDVDDDAAATMLEAVEAEAKH